MDKGMWGRVSAAVCVMAIGVAVALPAQARIHHHGHVTWAAADTAAIHPGTMMFTKGAQCTANFVFTDPAHHVYVGYAAHCAGTGASTDTDGCATDSLPLGTKVSFVDGATPVSSGTRVGTGALAYSSWLTMKAVHETDADTCAYNDLALVRVSRKVAATINPSVPVYGGPVGVGTSPPVAGDLVYSYGNSSLRGGVATLAPKRGVLIDNTGEWSHDVYTLTQGIPGDSGSGFLDATGRAFGVLSTIEAAPVPGRNGVGDLARELAYAQAHAIAGIALVPGTEAFTAGP